MVRGNPYTEGSQTAKAGTEVHEPDKRQDREDEIAHHIDVQTQEAEFLFCRSGSDWPKEHALTGGDPDICRLADRQEVSRGHSSYRQRAVIDQQRSHKVAKG